MTPEVEHFLELATRELESKAELREEAKGELMSRINHQGMPLEMLNLSEPVARLEGAKPPRNVVRRSLYVGSLLVLLIGFGIGAGFLVRNAVFIVQAQMMGNPYGVFGNRDSGKEPGVVTWAKARAPGLIFVGKSSGETAAALEKDPDDRALFQQHLLRLRNEKGDTWKKKGDAWKMSDSEMSDSDMATAERIDPGNGFYAFIQIESCMDRAIGATHSSRSSASSTIVDEPEFAKALEFFSKASGAERFSDYSGELRRRQLDAFPKADGFFEDAIHEVFAEQVEQSFGEYIGYDWGVIRMIEIRIDRLVKDGDAQGLLDLRADLLGFSRLLVADIPNGGVSGKGVKEWITSNATKIFNELDTLGQTNAEVELKALVHEIEALDFTYRSRHPTGPPSHSARFGSWTDLPSDLTRDQTKPAGRTEWALAERAMTYVAAVIALWLVLFTAFEAFRRTRQVKGLAKGLMPLFRWSDHLWIAGLGLVLPLVWYVGITRLTPLGVRDLALDDDDGVAIIVSAIQVSGALMFGAVAMLWATYWRWEKRGGFLCLRGGGVFLGWVLALLAAASIPAAGSVRFITFKDDDNLAMYLIGVSGLAVLGLLWLLWIGILNLCTPKANALRANLVSRTVLGWYLVGALCLVAGAELLRFEERVWIARDTLLPSWTSETHLNGLEERVAQEYHREMSRILGEE